jgi:hypothetical protein
MTSPYTVDGLVNYSLTLFPTAQWTTNHRRILHGSDGTTLGVVRITVNERRTIMKTIASVMLALTVLAGIVAPASATDAKSFYAQQDRESH